MLLNGESLHAKQSQQQADAATAGSTPDDLTNPSKVSKTLLDYYRERKDVVVPTAPRMRWMKDTIFKGAQLMHVQVRRRLIYMPYLIFIYIYILIFIYLPFCPILLLDQDRNVHGKIFGGYLMKKAYEIAHVAAVRAPVFTQK